VTGRGANARTRAGSERDASLAAVAQPKRGLASSLPDDATSALDLADRASKWQRRRTDTSLHGTRLRGFTHRLTVFALHRRLRLQPPSLGSLGYVS
jgi:hypothetical protein